MENGVTYDADISKVKMITIDQKAENASFPLTWDMFTNIVTVVFEVPQIDMTRLNKGQLLEDRSADIVDAEVVDVE